MRYTEEFLVYRQRLIDKLIGKVCILTFLKKNGEIREIVCTIPPLTGNSKNGKSLEVLSVFDLQKNEWRSLLINNLREIKELNVYVR